MTISVVNWDRYQHYKNRSPPWIKLHKRLLDSPGWFALEDGPARLLVEMWLIASEHDGEIHDDIDKLAFRLRRASNVLAGHLKTLRDNGFLDFASNVLADARPETETETESETEKIHNNYREKPNVENPYFEIEEEALSSPSVEVRRTITTSELVSLAKDRLGLGKDDPSNRELIVKWEGRGKSLDEIEAAILGLSDMRDKDLVGWDSIKPGVPVSCRALEGTHTLYEQGDGRAQRVLWDVAVEHYRRSAETATGPRVSGLRRITA